MFYQERLIPNFLYKNSLVMVQASAGSGKSWFAYSLCNLLLKLHSNITIRYLDADNGIRTLKNRNIDIVLKDSKFNAYQINGSKDFDIFKKLKNVI